LADPRAEYERRIARWSEAVQAGQRRHLLVSNLRLVVFAAAAAIAWLAFVRNAVPAPWALAPVAAFVALAAIHARILHATERAERARDLYRRGQERLDGRWSNRGADGARFVESVSYARDLDLFGPASLFQYLNAARTEAGEDVLASWLQSPAAIDEVRARHAAVRELAELVDFREALAVVAAETHVGRTSALDAWASRAPAGLTLAVGLLLLASGTISGVLIVAGVLGQVWTSVVLVWLGLQTALALVWIKRVNAIFHGIDAASYDLGVFRELVETIEKARFSADRLVALQNVLLEGGVPPSVRIARLQKWVSLMNQCEHNPYFRAIAVPLLIRGQVAVGIDLWHQANGRALAGWLRVVAELEALSSMGNFSYEHPDYPFPSVSPEGPGFEAAGLVHPLLPEQGAVANDIALGGAHPVVFIVSGSNMSGKSTLLRAIGVNVVLALAGAPVRASRLSLSPLAIGATIRVEDSLQAGHSRFYAEILRIRAIVDTARGPMPALFLLDEILHGTNSYDRRIGAGAIVRALVELGAIGLVTTHDLALTELAATLGARAANVHFEDEIVDGRIVFDYRMRPGVVERSNALALMRAVGLEV
jgi:hypothetical protein